MGRPPTRPITFRDGFYIEVRNKGASTGVKIRSDDAASMQAAAKDYSTSKEVVILGEHKKGKWVNEQPTAAGKSKSKAKAK
jgi:hypothetical protein